MRVEQAVGVVDPQAGHALARDDVEHQCVRGAEDFLTVAAQRGQGVDVEEAAVVDLVGSDPPVSQPIGL